MFKTIYEVWCMFRHQVYKVIGKKTGFKSRTNRGGFLRMTSILHGLFSILTRERGVWCGSGIDFDAPLDYCVIISCWKR